MLFNHLIPPETNHVEPENRTMPRRAYCKPSLIELGDLRTLTLGSSPSGNKDSGGGGLYEYTGFSPLPGFPEPGGFPTPGDFPGP